MKGVFFEKKEKRKNRRRRHCHENVHVCATQAGPLGSWTREATMTKKAQMIRLGFEGILELKGAYTRKVLKCEWSDDSNGD